MKKMSKRIIALMLSLVMLVTCIPMNIVNAEEGKITFNPNGGKGKFIGKLEDNPYIKLGKAFDDLYMSEPISDKIGTLKYVTENNSASSYYGATLDLSNFTTEEEVRTLIGSGYSITCGMCVAYICVKFVDGTGMTIKPIEGVNFGDFGKDDTSGTYRLDLSVVIELGIEGLQNGKEVVKKLLTEVTNLNQKIMDQRSISATLDLTPYGIDNSTSTCPTNLKFPSQVTTNDYFFTSGWYFATPNNKISKQILIHPILMGAEILNGSSISDYEFSPVIIMTDPRANHGVPDGFSKEDGAAYKIAVRQGIYTKAEKLLLPISVDPVNGVSLPKCPYSSPDGKKVFIGWSKTQTGEEILNNNELIDEETTLYAIWDDLKILDQPIDENDYSIKINANPLWEYYDDIECVLKERNEESLWENVNKSAINNGGVFRYDVTYNTNTINSDLFIIINAKLQLPYTKEEAEAITELDSIKGASRNDAKVMQIPEMTEHPELQPIVGLYAINATCFISAEEQNYIEKVIVNNTDITSNFVESEFMANESDVILYLIEHKSLWYKVNTDQIKAVKFMYLTSLPVRHKKKAKTPEKTETPEEKVVKEIEKNEVKKSNSEVKNLINPDAKFINGYEDGTFKPNKEVNNLELMCMVTQLFEDTGKVESNPIDLNQGENEWAGNICAMANSLNLIPGNKDDKDYNLYGDVTRADLAVVIYNLLKDYTPSQSLENKDTCTDAIGTLYEEAVAKLVDLGILKGFDDGLFHGDYTLTRAEAVVVINRTIQSLGFDIKLSNIVLTFPDLNEDHWAYNEIMYAANK